MRTSILIVVRNGMPYLPGAIESIRRQTVQDFEVIVQDGASTDGTLDYLRGVTDLKLDIVSEPDDSLGQAANRAWKRATGDIAMWLDADNRLEPHALEAAAQSFTAMPDTALLYGNAKLVTPQDDRLLGEINAGPFDYLDLISCKLVPPFAATFACRKNLPTDWGFDERMRSVPDFSAWLKAWDRPIHHLDFPLARIAQSPGGITMQLGRYRSMVAEKKLLVREHLYAAWPEALAASLYRRASLGIDCWGCESVLVFPGDEAVKEAIFFMASARAFKSETPRYLMTLAALHNRTQVLR